MRVRVCMLMNMLVRMLVKVFMGMYMVVRMRVFMGILMGMPMTVRALKVLVAHSKFTTRAAAQAAP